VRRIRTFTVSSLALAVVTIALCVLSPLRQTSGDAAAGRVSAAVLRCTGTFDVSRAEWIAKYTSRGRILYWMQRDESREYTSVFGPAPAVVGAIALADFGEGATIDDESLRARERAAAAVLLALAAALLAIAMGARASVARSIAAGALAAASFAGAATLGQGLWQATVALPFLAGALAALAWRDQRPRAALATPALLVVAVMIRPTIAPLALGLGVAWALPTRDFRTWIIAAAIAVVAAAPFVVWNAIHLNSPLPLGQWTGNTRIETSVFSPLRLVHGLPGLVASPSRGLLWFAPIAILGMVLGFVRGDRTARIIAGGVVLQLVVMAMFFKWHGGLAFGPRMLAEATWLAIWLALAYPGARWLERACAAITVAVGLLGLALYTPDRWETRRKPEIDDSAFWDVADSPLTALVIDHETKPTTDSDPVPAYRCADGIVRSDQ
jgi:hypothetical protein